MESNEEIFLGLIILTFFVAIFFGVWHQHRQKSKAARLAAASKHDLNEFLQQLHKPVKHRAVYS